MNQDNWLHELNTSTNIIACLFMLIALLFVLVHQADIAKELVIGSLSFAGGGAMARRNQTTTTDSTVVVTPAEPKG